MRMTSFLFCLGLLFFVPVISKAQYIGPTAGQKVAFLGDSITAQGFGKSAGYVQLVGHALESTGNKIDIIPAGVGGNTSRDMLARLDRDVISKKPDWMTLSCGVNDVWHGVNGVALDEYQKNITEIVNKAQAAGIKVVVLTATMITEDQAVDNNQKLLAYNQFLRALAKEKGLILADLNAAEQATLADNKAKFPQLKGNYLTVDGVHMNPVGDQMMATGILKALGVTDAQISEATKTWNGLGSATQVSITPSLTVSQYLHLRALAASQGKTMDEVVTTAVKSDLEALLNTPIPSPTTSAPTPAAPAPAKP
jgi:lysophospholipase L1-like esterase